MGDAFESAADVHAIIQRKLVCEPCQRGDHVVCRGEAVYIPSGEQTGCHCGFFNTEKEARTVLNIEDLPPMGTRCARGRAVTPSG